MTLSSVTCLWSAVPFLALGPELTDDSDERASLYMYVKIAEGIGVMVGSLTPSILSGKLKNRAIYKLIAIVFGSFYIVAMYTLIKNVKERPASLTEASIRQPFVTSLYRSIGNVAFRPLVIGWILVCLCVGVSASVFTESVVQSLAACCVMFCFSRISPLSLL